MKLKFIKLVVVEFFLLLLAVFKTSSDPSCGRDFKCATNRWCIPHHWKCDGYNDCGDNSDELCPTVATEVDCIEGDFKCNTKRRCIKESWVCDGENDCGDNSDELSCSTTERCAGNYFQCNNTKECIPNKQKCDSVDDCGDNSDENSCEGEKSWIYFSNTLNIRKVLQNGEEDTVAVANKSGVVSFDFDIANNQIYWSDVISNNIQRATLGQPETSKTIVTHVSTPDGLAFDWITKKIYWTDNAMKTIAVADVDGNYTVILVDTAMEKPRGIVVDPFQGFLYWSDWGKAACVEKISMDGASETRTKIVSDNIVWPNGLAIDLVERKIYWIDAKLKRIEAADLNGEKRIIIREIGSSQPFALDIFENMLYWTDWKSNSIKGMSRYNTSTIFTIQSHLQQVMGVKVWNTARQTRDPNPCGVNNFGCSHLCLLANHNGNHTVVCKCPRNMNLDASHKRCVTLNITKELNTTDATSAISSEASSMTSSVGSSKCIRGEFQCANGRCIVNTQQCDGTHDCRDNSDENNCTDDNTWLYFSTRHEIIKKSLNHAESVIAVSDVIDAICFDFDIANNHIYWGDTWTKKIQRAIPSEPNTTETILDYYHKPGGLAFDWIGRNIYWTDTRKKTIEVADASGKYLTVLVDTDLDEPRAIVLDPHEGFLYWSDLGETAGIEKISMDGANDTRVKIVSENIIWPNGLTVDIAQRKIYWIDAKLKRIEEADLNGENRILIKEGGGMKHPFALDIFQDILYWSDWQTHIIRKISNSEPYNMSSVHSHFYQMMDIKVWHSSKQVRDTNPCDSFGCSHLCLLRNHDGKRTVVCKCPLHMILGVSEKECIAQTSTRVKLSVCEELAISKAPTRRTELSQPTTQIQTTAAWVYFSNKEEIKKVLSNGTSYSNVVSKGELIVNLDFDILKKHIYWIDLLSRRIQRATLDVPGTVQTVLYNLTKPIDLAVDWIGRNIYWIDSENKNIEVADLNGHHKAVLANVAVGKLRSIVVDPHNRFVYWSFWGDAAGIERISMDGASDTRMKIITENIIWPNGLTIDLAKQRIYWADANLDRIEAADLNGDYRVIIRQGGISHPFGLDYFEGALYWTDWLTRSVHRMLLSNTNNITTLQTTSKKFMGIAVWHPTKQAEEPNPCGDNNCSHLCLLGNHDGSHTVACMCPQHMSLDESKKICV